uniref:Uncharacterized protein n=1 Tax=Steinernema glaseri TaxID=37863 RepID=A0A1I7Y5N7_9BILA
MYTTNLPGCRQQHYSRRKNDLPSCPSPRESRRGRVILLMTPVARGMREDHFCDDCNTVRLVCRSAETNSDPLDPARRLQALRRDVYGTVRLAGAQAKAIVVDRVYKSSSVPLVSISVLHSSPGTFVVDDGSSAVPCKIIPSVDLTLWKDPQDQEE